MASPERIFRIYHALAEQADTVREFQVAKGEKVSGTVNMILAGKPEKFLVRWGEEMAELCGVLAGTHDDPYILEATQCFYWGSLYAVTSGVDWEALDFHAQRSAAAANQIDDPGELLIQAERLVACGLDAKPNKLFLLWCMADGIYRATTPADNQWTLDQIMESDLAEMKTRSYLAPILDMVPEGD